MGLGLGYGVLGIECGMLNVQYSFVMLFAILGRRMLPRPRHWHSLFLNYFSKYSEERTYCKIVKIIITSS